MMIKTMSASDHQQILRGEPSMVLLKIASSGFGFNDRQFFIKRAGAQLADAITRTKFEPGEVPAHSIALGASEWFGLNRNADGFKEATCKKYHHTFKTHARAFRDHLNKNPRKSYGIIKESWYNEPMHRIELLMAYNGTKEAADRNEGLVADKELELLNKGSDFDTSMACKIPYDQCTICGNRARTRAEYCSGEHEGGHCKGGGLKNHIGDVLESGEHLGADNPDPLWFDNSKVWRHADRIASASLVKAASERKRVGGAEQAELLGVTMPWSIAIDHNSGPDVELAVKLAEYEREFEAGRFPDALHMGLVSHPAAWPKPPVKVAEAFDALILHRASLPVEGFFVLAAGESYKTACGAVQARLPGIYTRMIEDGSIEKRAADSLFQPSRKVPSREAKDWAAKIAQHYSLDRPSLLKRALTAGLSHRRPTAPSQLSDSRSDQAEEFARYYATQKLAFLRGIREENSDFDLACRMVVAQNYLQ